MNASREIVISGFDRTANMVRPSGNTGNNRMADFLGATSLQTRSSGMMRYLSVCSGIEAATVAWEPLGWTPVAFAEIEKFPSAVLAYRWPHVPNLGDFALIDGESYRGAVDLIVGGTPCQGFSLAGKRGGLADPRSGLALAFVKLVRDVRPTWIVWENVPGVLSQNKGRDFALFTSALAECGYHCAYRILDAQYFGVPQRRRRVYLVGYLGDWRPAAAVLFEPESLRRDSPPGGKAQADLAGIFESDIGRCRGEGVNPSVFGGNNTSGEISVSPALNAHGGGSRRMDFESEAFIAYPLRAQSQSAEVAGTLGGGSGARGWNNSLDVCGAFIPVAFHGSQDPDVSGDVTHPVGRNNGLETCVCALAIRGRDGGCNIEMRRDGLANTVCTPNGGRGGMGVGAVLYKAGVRRLTPVECARLQGFPDNHTAVPWRGKDTSACPDGPQYKAYGNSMPVPVMRWIGERIEARVRAMRQAGK